MDGDLVSVLALTRLAESILRALGASESAAERVANSLVESDRRGSSTHGLSLLPLYAEMVSIGVIDPSAEPKVEPLSGSLARVRGNYAFGQLSGALAVESGLELLPAAGISSVVVADGAHLGRLGEWAELACESGAAMLAFTNTSGGALNVAGPGSAERVLSTNPVAIGIPSFGSLDHHVVVDFASSQVSGSRIRETINAGKAIDPDWVCVGNDAPPDLAEAFLGGYAALQPLGGNTAGHKGFGLMVAAELLAAMAGGAIAGERDKPGFSNAALFCFIDVDRFINREQWGVRLRAFRDYLSTKGCRLPGAGKNQNRESDEFNLAQHTVDGLLSVAQSLGINNGEFRSTSAAVQLTQTW